jgi:microcystin-dependent protein
LVPPPVERDRFPAGALTMSEPFLGELRLMSWNFAPQGWAQANGQLLPINQNQALFSLLGTTYGGNGQTNFALPNLQGRSPIHMGGNFTLGTVFGTESHTLTLNEMPAHTHAVGASTKDGDQPQLGLPASANNLYGNPADLVPLHPGTIPNVGGSQPHQNASPSLVLLWCIALVGVFPSRN